MHSQVGGQPPADQYQCDVCAVSVLADDEQVDVFT
jgi:hypothetical protein